MATSPARSAPHKANRISACIAAAKALEAALRGELLPIPDDWFSRQQYQDEHRLTRDKAKSAIQKMKDRGLLEIKHWKTERGTVPIYRLK